MSRSRAVSILSHAGYRAISLCGLLAACTQPDDRLFTKPAVPPADLGGGLFRATWHEGPDVVRGFTADGARIVYQSRDVPGFGPGWYVLSIAVADGSVREEASIYRQALRDTVGHLVIGAAERLMVTWRDEPGGFTCPLCPPGPTAIDLAILRLPREDGAPVGALPVRAVNLPNHGNAPRLCAGGSVDATGLRRVRVVPAEQEIRARRVNPFGPVERADRAVGFYSNGETIWRYDPGDATAAPDSLGPGVFPALSPDGSLLAAAVPTGVDSAWASCFFGLCPCEQVTVTMTWTGWQTLLYDLAADTVATLGPGAEPVFDPSNPRVVVRRPDALYWVELASGSATPIPRTEGGYAPAFSPDGAVLAFTMDAAGNPDVFFLRLR